ncbi:MAG: hypothetical protein H0X62_14900 [Bacteroidetes bacterium]|nr:hypothetical protein [Bacteroidota bacterium]
MKSSNALISKITLAMFIVIMPFFSNAHNKTKSKAPGAWKKEFDNRVAYNQQNKKILKNAVVLLEVSIDENGYVNIEHCNGTSTEATIYLFNKFQGILLESLPEETRFILKYVFK